MPEGIPSNSVFQVENKCYSCYPDIYNSGGENGEECIIRRCAQGWSEDWYQGILVCYKCPIGMNRNFGFSPENRYGCYNRNGETSPAEIQPRNKTWTYIGSLENYEWLGIL